MGNRLDENEFYDFTQAELEEGSKVCSKCKMNLPKNRFHLHIRNTSGLNCQCKLCHNKGIELKRIANPSTHKEIALKSMYGITQAQYDQILQSQGGVCYICEKPEWMIDYRTGKVKRLAIDHCHISGKIHGLLCGNCNVGKGHIGTIENAYRMIAQWEKDTGFIVPERIRKKDLSRLNKRKKLDRL